MQYNSIDRDKAQAVSYLVACEGYTLQEAQDEVFAAYSQMNQVIDDHKRRTCALQGHAYRDESYGGPESGAIAMTCQRCGHHVHHTLY